MFKYPELNEREWARIEKEKLRHREKYFTEILSPAIPEKLQGKISVSCCETDDKLWKTIKKVKKTGGKPEKNYVTMAFPSKYFDLESAKYEYTRAHHKRFVQEKVFPPLQVEVKKRIATGDIMSIAKAFAIKYETIKHGDFNDIWEKIVYRLIKFDTYNLERLIRELLHKVSRLLRTPPDYENPDIPQGNFIVERLRNVYRFFEFSNPDILPHTNIPKDAIPYSIRKLFETRQSRQIKDLLYIIFPAYVSAVVSNKMRSHEWKIPSILRDISYEEALAIHEITRKYEDIFSLHKKVGRKTLLDVYLKLSSFEKKSAAHDLFGSPLMVKNLKNAYIYLMSYMEKQGLPDAENLAGYHAANNIPGKIFEIFGLNLKDVIGLKERYFEILPRIAHEIVSKKRPISDVPDEIKPLQLCMDDYKELWPYLRKFRNYGILDAEKSRHLLGRGRARVTNKIFFNSALRDPILRDRDILNIKFLRRLYSKEKGRPRTRFENGDRVPIVVFHKFGVPIGDFKALNAALDEKRFERRKPHFYFDKNILIDFTDYFMFKKTREINSVTLVYAVLKGEIIGSVSTSCVTSVYNHLRWRLARPLIEGGAEYTEDNAEKMASKFIETYFLQPASPWNIITIDQNLLKEAIRKRKKNTLSLEDSIENVAFGITSSQANGATIFVTRDKDFENGVHPVDVVQSHKSFISKIIKRE